MLRAIFHKKTRLHHRYLGHRELGENHVRAEDEITSNFFDALSLLGANDGLLFWRGVLGSEESEAFFPSHAASHVEWRFWPRRSSAGRLIEPDLHVVFRWPDGMQRHLLVELKWRSGIGDNQLQDQWLKYLNQEERAGAVHVFIARDVAQALVARASLDVWEHSQFVLRPWIEVRHAMRCIRGGSASLHNWIKLADNFLECLQISAFRGLPQPVAETNPLPSERPVFWRGPNFNWSAPSSQRSADPFPEVGRPLPFIFNPKAST